MSNLEQSVSNAYDTFIDLAGTSGDPNTIDVIWIGKSIQEQLSEPLSTTTIPLESMVSLVELVESTFINDLIRNKTKEELFERTQKLAEAIRDDLALDLSEEQSVIIALSLWHGCICMAKTTRIDDSSGQVYTDDLRKSGYNSLTSLSIEAENAGNPWVKRGITVAKELIKKRKNIAETNWIPKDSPYWG